VSSERSGQAEHSEPGAASKTRHYAKATDSASVAQGVVGRNGVAIPVHAGDGPKDYRTYEVYQRERVGQSTPKLKPGELRSTAFLDNPYELLGILREDYPCYRDWTSNAFWISQYDDVTSIFADEANFETRPKLWYYNQVDYGWDLRAALPVLEAQARGMDDFVQPSAEEIFGDLKQAPGADLAMGFAARPPLMILARSLGLPSDDFGFFAERYWLMQRGWLWQPQAEQKGLRAMEELSAYFDPLVQQRRADPGPDLISAIAGLDVDGPPTAGRDVTVTLLEGDHETLHGGLANMWALLLSHPDQFDLVRRDRRMVKYAFLETLRHSTPTLMAQRFARHEVERFGRLLPEGALLICAAGAANRDPRIYQEPDRFIVGRKDLCQREPRGQFRADGLAAGIAFGLGKPSIHPALPEDRPRSLYALTRDTASTASNLLLDAFPNLRLHDEARIALRSLRWGEMHTCWHLPVVLDRPGRRPARPSD